MLCLRQSSRLRVVSAVNLTLPAISPFSTHSYVRRKRSSRIGQTSVFLQTGLKIRELPLVVKKVNDVLNISGMDRFQEALTPNKVRDFVCLIL